MIERTIPGVNIKQHSLTTILSNSDLTEPRSGVVQFSFNRLIEQAFILLYPRRSHHLRYGPVIIITSLHPKKDPVTTIIHRIDTEELRALVLKFCEIKFTKPAAGFDNPCKGYCFNKVDHRI